MLVFLMSDRLFNYYILSDILYVKELFIWRRASLGTRACSLCRDDFIPCLYETLEAGWLAKLNHYSHRYKGVFIINNQGWYRRETNLIEKKSATQLFG